MNRGILYSIIGVVVVGGVGYFWVAGSNGNGIRYRTDKVTRGDITVQVRATGTINPVQTVQVGSQVSGIIQKLYVDFNSTVKKDQVIAQIDSTFLEASVKEAVANREKSLAQVSNTKRTLDRTDELFKKNLVAQADLDAAKTAYESAVADLKQTDAALDRAKVNLRYALIRSPIDGVVISRDVDVGQTVAASFQTPNLFKIANDLRRMQVEASVDEADIGQVKSGEDVSFTVDAYADEQFHGNVSQVRLSPITVQNVVTYTVIIDVPNPDLKLRPGMTATVSILVDKRSNTLRIPSVALQYQPSPDVAKGNDTSSGRQGGRMGGNRAPRQGGQEGGGGGQGGGGRQGGQGNFAGGQGGTGGGTHQWRQQQGGDAGEAPQKKFARVYILDESKTPRQVNVVIGIADNRYTEVISGDLKEGEDIILGTAMEASGGQQQSNPFQQRMPGGGGRRGM